MKKIKIKSLPKYRLPIISFRNKCEKNAPFLTMILQSKFNLMMRRKSGEISEKTQEFAEETAMQTYIIRL